jgi:hypothetical protein
LAPAGSRDKVGSELGGEKLGRFLQPKQRVVIHNRQLLLQAVDLLSAQQKGVEGLASRPIGAVRGTARSGGRVVRLACA